MIRKTHISDRRLASAGRQGARSDHARRRPRDEDSARWWAPAFREAYDDERRKLGCCDPDDHDWEETHVDAETADVIRRSRLIGSPIELCARCGVWRDRDER